MSFWDTKEGFERVMTTLVSIEFLAVQIERIANRLEHLELARQLADDRERTAAWLLLGEPAFGEEGDGSLVPPMVLQRLARAIRNGTAAAWVKENPEVLSELQRAMGEEVVP